MCTSDQNQRVRGCMGGGVSFACVSIVSHHRLELCLLGRLLLGVVMSLFVEPVLSLNRAHVVLLVSRYKTHCMRCT